MKIKYLLSNFYKEILAYDIGLARFRTAIHVLLCLATGICTGYGMALLLCLPVAFGMTMGGVAAFQLAFGISDKTWKAELKRSLFTLIPTCCGFTLAIILHAYRPLALIMIILILAFQLYASHLGLWAADIATGLYGTFLIGLLIPLEVSTIPMMTLIIVVSGLLAIMVRLLILRPNARRSLLLARKGYWVRLRTVFNRAIERLEIQDDKVKINQADKRLDKALKNIQTAALQMDGLISFEGSEIEGELAYELNQIIFDTEQGVTAIAHCVAPLSLIADDKFRQDLIYILRELEIYDEKTPAKGVTAQLEKRITAAHEKLSQVDFSDKESKNLLLHFFNNLEWLIELHGKWVNLWGVNSKATNIPFESVVELNNAGRLLGSIQVVSRTEAHGKMSIQERTTIQAIIALIIMEPIALLLSSYRFYWGDIGVMVVLAGAFTQRERVRKTWGRIWGTVLGATIGLLLAHLLANNGPLEICVIILGISFGSFHISSRYGLWVTGLVIALCQMYAVTGVLTPMLMPLRLLENGLGAIIACCVSAVVLPISSKENLREGLKSIFASVERFAISLPLSDKANLRAFTNEMNLGLYQLRSGSLYPVGLLHVNNRRDAMVRAQLENLFYAMGQLTIYLEKNEGVAYESIRPLVYAIRGSAQRLQQLCSGEKPTSKAEWTDLCHLPKTREIELLTRIKDSLNELEAWFADDI